MGPKVIDARSQAGHVTTDQVKLDMIEGPGTRRRSKGDLTRAAAPPARDAVGEEAEPGEQGEVRNPLIRRRLPWGGDRVQGGHGGRGKVRGQGERLYRRINLI